MSEWYMSSFMFKAGETVVDREQGKISNVAIVTAGEAKGHGVFLDREFVDSVVLAGNESKNGLKMRFGHPSMSSTALGTFIGRAKNFRSDGDIARADVFLSKEAKNAPGGDLYEYVLGMAENEADMFGTSIVFRPGEQYQRNEDGEKTYKGLDRDEPVFVEMDKLMAVDMVDDPAANPDGLFSAFNENTIAGQVSEFLDTHPQVWEVLSKKPEIINGFMAKYEEYRERFHASHINEEGSVEPSNEQASVDAEPLEENIMEKELMQKINDEFGADILAQTMLNDGDYEYAQALKDAADQSEVVEQLSASLVTIEMLEANCAELQAKLDALSQGEDDTAEFEDAPEEPAEDKSVDILAEIAARTEEGMSSREAQNAVREQYPEEFKTLFEGE